MKHIIPLIFLILAISSCEKDIMVDLPPSKQQYVVEASINQRFPYLNYVFISRSIDYFNPDVSVLGVKGASVFITEGTINGYDTLYSGTRTQLFDLSDNPIFDSLFKGLSGIYFNASLSGKENKAYLLEIRLPDGTYITGKTYIPKVVPIDTIRYEVKNQDVNHDQHKDAYVTLYFTDPPEQNNYRLNYYNYPDSLMLGWGSANSFRTFDDQVLNGVQRVIPYNGAFQQGDTLNFFLNSIGRKEFLFWQSFGSASNNNGPFSTPGAVKSNVSGAIGSFTGYGCAFRQIILN